MINSERERLLCYTAGLIGSYLASPSNQMGLVVDKWMIDRAIKAANMMIDTIYDDDKLFSILNGDKT